MIDSVFEEEDFFGFGIGVPSGQSLQASSSNPSRESRGQQGGFDEERDGGIEEVEVFCHGALSRLSGAVGANSQGIIASGGAKTPARSLGA